MRSIKPIYWFWLGWLLLGWYLGQFGSLPKGPESVHQGAQSDRACVAWNYYHESMNFFQPRVSEDRQSDGIAGMEFPAIPYTAALCYKIFGPHEIIYRLILYLLVSLGVFYAWKITGFFIQKSTHRLLVLLGWYCSPILVFYTANFLPDPAAMAFVLIAWFHLLRCAYGVEPGKNLRLFALFITLAGLLKVSFLLYLIAGFLLFALWPLFGENQLLQLRLTWRGAVWFILPVIPVGAWYTYANQLTQKTSNMHFLQRSNPAESIGAFFQNSQSALNNWQESLYRPGFIYVFFLFLTFLLLFRMKQALLPGLSAALMLLGFGGIWILFNKQFLYHDYYFILAFPALLFGWIFIQQLFLEHRGIFIGLIPVVVLIAFWIIPFSNAGHAAKMMNRRYQDGDFYHQNAFDGATDLVKHADTLTRIIPDGERVFYAFDVTPNTALYLLKKRGVRISKDFGPEITADILSKSRARYLVLNDSALWFSRYEPVLKTGAKWLYHQDLVWVYRLP